MDLPASVTALGEHLRDADEFAPDPALFRDADVFAAERERIFSRPLMAIDHQTRLSGDGDYFRCDIGLRSVIVTRENGGRLHVLRNVCIHAGYPICDAEEGSAERLICPYHGWEFALDGRLLEPALSSRIDPSRLRLTSYPVHVRGGLVFVDLSGGAATLEGAPIALPGWLAEARVTRRARYNTAWNWKSVLHFLQSHPDLFFDHPRDADDRDHFLDFGPLSSMILRSHRAVLLRVVPKFAEQTDLQVIEMAAEEGPQKLSPEPGSDAVADELRRAAAPPRWFDRPHAERYWSLMSAAR
jgi:phenylpropionate dioxygenase-like ring-hydroxylating dioxygenase large terminal subunit